MSGAAMIVSNRGEDGMKPVGSKYLRCRLTCGVSGKGATVAPEVSYSTRPQILPSHRWSYPTHWRSRKSRSGH